MKSLPCTTSSSSRKITFPAPKIAATASPMLRIAPYPRSETHSPVLPGASSSMRDMTRAASTFVTMVMSSAGWVAAMARTRRATSVVAEMGHTTSRTMGATSWTCSSEVRQRSSSGEGLFSGVEWSYAPGACGSECSPAQYVGITMTGPTLITSLDSNLVAYPLCVRWRIRARDDGATVLPRVALGVLLKGREPFEVRRARKRLAQWIP